MGTGRRFDFILGGNGYLLQRGQFKGRAWSKVGTPDTPGRRSAEDAKYGVVSDELDHPEVWDDWSGGAFHPYRRQGENTYHWAENFDARFPRQLVHAQAWLTMTTPTNLVGTGNLDYNWAIDGPSPHATERKRPGTGRVLFPGRYKFADAEPTGTGMDFMTGITAMSVSLIGRPAIFGSFFYLGVAEATQFLRLSMAYSVVNTDDHTMQAKIFAVTGDRLWKASSAKDDVNGPVRYIQNVATDPAVTANWSATYQVGNGDSSIKDMIGLEDQLVLGLEDGLYVGDASGTFVNVTGQLRTQRHYDNCRDLTLYDNGVIVPHISGLYWYRTVGLTSQIDEIGPQSPGPNNPIVGYPRATKAVGPWLVAGYWTGSQSFILSGRPNGNNWIWHPLTKLPQVPVSKISRLHLDGITVASGGNRQIPNRIWAITDASLGLTGSAPVYHMPIPFNFGNTLSPQGAFSANYVGSAQMDFGNTDSGAPGTPKVHRTVEVWADNLQSGYRYGDIYYQLDQCGSFALLGRANNSPKSTLYFSAGEGSFVTGQSIELRLASFSASPALTPVYRSILLRSSFEPNSVDQITAVVRLADGMRDRQNQAMRSAATMKEELRVLGKAKTPTTLIDLTGAVSYVNVSPVQPEQESYQGSDENPELSLTIKMVVLDYTGS